MLSIFGAKRKTKFRLNEYFNTLNTIPMEIAAFDPQGHFIFLNNYFMTNGIPSKEFIGKDDEYYFYRLGIDPQNIQLRKKYFQQALKNKRIVQFTEKLYFPKKNRTFYYKRILKPILDETGNRVLAVTMFGNNLTHVILSQKELKYLAYHDKLTGLRNRDAFYDHLDQLIHEAMRNPHELSAVLFIDLDNFKIINDSLGHDFGDLVLQESAQRMVQSLRKSDLIFRLGGDEFTIVLRNLKREWDAASVAGKLISVLSKPYKIKNEVISSITASIGIALIPRDGLERDTIVKNADMAMYAVKNTGKSGYRYYSVEMTQDSLKRLQIVNQLRQVIEKQDFDNQFTMVYQPILSKNGKDKNYKIIGIEALIRWQNPQLGSVPPSTFIPIAEESKLIQSFNQWIIQRSIKDFKEIQPYHNNGFYLSINASPKGLHTEDFSRNLQNALLQNQLNPKSLQVEITETSLLDNDSLTQRNLTALAGMGLKLAIDDFGTGYASLNYLQKIPASTIKIDRSFIDRVNVDPKNQELVRAILLMGKSLNKNLIAEGVETQDHLQFLEENACRQFQGYLFSKPLPKNDLIDLISGHNMELTLP